MPWPTPPLAIPIQQNWWPMHTLRYSPQHARESTTTRVRAQFLRINRQDPTTSSTQVRSNSQRTHGSNSYKFTFHQKMVEPSPSATTASESSDSDKFPQHAKRTHDCYVSVRCWDEPTGKVYTDQTGKFPCTSAGGHNYVMVIYDYDSNDAILMEPIRDHKGTTLLEAHKILHARLTHAGIRPRFIMMDNECFNALKQLLTDEQSVAFN